jgi:hypothetical protein
MSRIFNGVRILIPTLMGILESAEYSASPDGRPTHRWSPGRSWCVAAASDLCYACLPKRTTSTRSQTSQPPRARARVFSSPGWPPVGAAIPRFPYNAETAKSAAPDLERPSSCFPHSVNRRASACGPGRKPAPQPPPPHGGRVGAAVPERAGARSTASYPQPFQTSSGRAPRLTTVFPRVFHRARSSPVLRRPGPSAAPAAPLAPVTRQRRENHTPRTLLSTGARTASPRPRS